MKELWSKYDERFWVCFCEFTNDVDGCRNDGRVWIGEFVTESRKRRWKSVGELEKDFIKSEDCFYGLLGLND